MHWTIRCEGILRSFRYYFTLMLLPVGFFAVIGALQVAILWQAYQQQADMQVRPYADGRPIPVIEKKIDRRPQSINIPSLDTGAPPDSSAKTGRALP